MPRHTTREPDELDTESFDYLDTSTRSRRRMAASTTDTPSKAETSSRALARPASREAGMLRDAARRASDSPRSGSSRSQSASSNGSRSSSRGRASSRDDKSARLLPTATQTPPRALAYEIAGVLCVAVGAVLLYNARLPMAEGVLPRLGVGALRLTFGIGAYIIPMLLCALGVLLIVRRHRANLRAFGRGVSVGFLVLLTGVHLAVPRGHEFFASEIKTHGGFAGGALAWMLRRALGEIGAVIALLALTLVAVLFFSEISLSQVGGRIGSLFSGGVRGVRRIGSKTRDSFLHTDAYDDEEDEYEEYEEPRPRQPKPREILQNNVKPASTFERNKLRSNSPFLPVDELLDEEEYDAGHEDLPFVTKKSGPEVTPFDSAVATHADDLESANGVEASNGTAAAAPEEEPSSTSPAKSKIIGKVAEEPAAPRIEFTDAPPPVSVLETPIVVTPMEAKPEDEMTPIEKLEAQALATAGTGEGVDTARAQRPQKPRRRFGEGPLRPEYFDDAVRALDPPVPPDITGAEDDIQSGVKAVQDTLGSFKIDARVTDVKRGPVITRYEVQPAPGVRVSSIANLDRDMARSLSALAVRIEAPVPGKDVVGIEVPNKRVHLVRLRDVLERNEFLAAPSKLAFVLGKDIAGQPKWADLTKMPHMLIAGATNSGKSVCLNSIIASILVRATPEEVKFSLIDPKRVELTLFKDIRHLYHPVVVEPKDAVRALRGAIAEMDRRYKRFAERGVRNIASYNSKLEEGEAPLPYLVIVIDELADLMMTAAAEFEKLICRLAQLARATGIHLIVATQRPSVNVITGVIKANIPSRIAFAVASQVDSRTILDSVGAERLIGSGDMLFDANNGGKPVRIQGAYLSEEEVNRVVEVVKAHYEEDEPIEYGMDLSVVDEDDVNEANEKMAAREEKRDELYDDILEYVLRNTEMSASMIQRKFEIGYPRAGRIVDQLERDGVLSAANGSKPRRVVGNGRGQSMEED